MAADLAVSATSEFVGPLPLVAESEMTRVDGSQNASLSQLRSSDYTNHVNRYDVDGDGKVNSRDVQSLVNNIEEDGIYHPSFVGPRPRTYWDTNGDAELTPIDVLLVLNEIARSNAEAVSTDVQFRLELTDPTGTPVDSLRVGDDFLLNVFVRDNRERSQGVFAAYTDVIFDPAIAMPTSAPEYGDTFPNQRSGDASARGLINELGGVGATSQVTSGEQLLATVQLRATSAGYIRFASSMADVRPDHVILLHGEDDAIGNDRVNYGAISISVFGKDLD